MREDRAGRGRTRGAPLDAPRAVQYEDTAPSDVSRGESTGADSSLGHANKGSILNEQTRGRMSYAEAARIKLPFQQPEFLILSRGKISLYPS
jgi:hypothetical protein